MSKVEHPEDNESIEYGVSFVRVQSQPEPQEYSFSHHKRRPDGATSLPTILHGSLDARLVSMAVVGFKVSFALT